jgi:tetratricopeptide (TPR) repeat protein
LLGLIAAQSGKSTVAKSLFIRAIAVNSNSAAAHSNLGIVLSELNELENSVESFDRALRINPKFFNAYINCGDVLRKLGRFQEALNCYDLAISLDGKNAGAFFNRAILFQILKQFDESLHDYKKAISLKSNFHEAFGNMGSVLQKLNRFDEAVIAYNISISIVDNNKEIHFKKAELLKKMGLIDQAISSYTDAIILDEHYIEAIQSRGLAFIEIKNFEFAQLDFCRIISLQPNNSDAYSNRGICRSNLGQADEAIDDFKTSVLLNPFSAVAHYNYGNALQDRGSVDDALKCFKTATALNPDYDVAHMNEGLCSLLLGDFGVGWEKYEWRLKSKKFRDNALAGHTDLDVQFSTCNRPVDFSNQTVFIASEQGIGDYIMFLSILPDLLKDAGKVICELDQRMIGLFSRCFPEVIFVKTGDAAVLGHIKVDRYIRMGSLGYTYRKDIHHFPRKPYLTPDPVLAARWKLRFPSEPARLNVGISWRGGSMKSNGQLRSLQLEQLAPMLERDDCVFVSLQHGAVDEEIDSYNAKVSNKLIRFPKKEIDDFDDFAGLIETLDCVVSVDNTNVQFCGAIGKKCHVMLPYRPEWRYGVSGSKMPWYPSIKLHRQVEEGEWSQVIQKLVFELDEHVNAKVVGQKIENASQA